MEIKGQIILIGPVENGESTRGPWKKSYVVLLTDERYEKKASITVFGAQLTDELMQYDPGDFLTCKFDLESREFNGKWYTEAKAWKITGYQQKPSGSNQTPRQQTAARSQHQNLGSTASSTENITEPTFDDDLPF